MDPVSLVPSMSRRRLLAAVGVGAAAAATPSLPLLKSSAANAATTSDTSCAATDTDAQEVGPFYVPDGLVRSDITSGEDGIPLTFTITVTDSATCEPLVGAAVDVWHASALGVYSDESSESTLGETYLRGIQIIDSEGTVTFTSIYPGWYAGRTNHIHARIYTGGTVTGTSFDYNSASLIHTGQMFFDPDINTAVAAVSPYSSNTVARTTNAEDRVYTTQHGSETLTTTTGNTTDGYTSSVTYTVSSDATTKDASALSLVASSAAVRYGEKVTLSGVLRDTTTNNVIAGEQIIVTGKTPSGKKGSVAATTSNTGTWSLRFAPETTATYHAHVPSAGYHKTAKSASVTVNVHQRVAITDVSGTGPASKPVHLKGTVAPARHGTNVVIHAVVGGKRHTVAHTKTDAKGKWSTSLRMSKGKHHLVVTVPATKNLAAGTSRKIVVHRT